MLGRAWGAELEPLGGVGFDVYVALLAQFCGVGGDVDMVRALDVGPGEAEDFGAPDACEGSEDPEGEGFGVVFLGSLEEVAELVGVENGGGRGVGFWGGDGLGGVVLNVAESCCPVK